MPSSVHSLFGQSASLWSRRCAIWLQLFVRFVMWKWSEGDGSPPALGYYIQRNSCQHRKLHTLCKWRLPAERETALPRTCGKSAWCHRPPSVVYQCSYILSVFSTHTLLDLIGLIGRRLLEAQMSHMECFPIRCRRTRRSDGYRRRGLALPLRMMQAVNVMTKIGE